MLSAFFAHAARDIGGIGAVSEVVPTGCRQRSIEGSEPFIVGLGQSPDLVRGEAKITEHSPEGLASVNGV
jgi:hypothetical protein